jgi:hypothetical protein
MALVVAPVNSSGSCGQRVRCVPVVLPDACQEAVEVRVNFQSKGLAAAL